MTGSHEVEGSIPFGSKAAARGRGRIRFPGGLRQGVRFIPVHGKTGAVRLGRVFR